GPCWLRPSCVSLLKMDDLAGSARVEVGAMQPPGLVLGRDLPLFHDHDIEMNARPRPQKLPYFGLQLVALLQRQIAADFHLEHRRIVEWWGLVQDNAKLSRQARLQRKENLLDTRRNDLRTFDRDHVVGPPQDLEAKARPPTRTRIRERLDEVV